MSRKPKVAVVAGEVAQPRFLQLFQPLRDAFDVTVYVLHNERMIDLHGTGLKLRVYETIADMPGYMRGLEEELSGVDLIIGLETSRLATFQAVRAARKFGVPIAVVVNEFQPYFYERFANIRAIQFDICNKAERFWATSEAAAANLRLDSVPAESIGLLPPVVDLGRFHQNASGRNKFREYVGISPEDVVVLFHGDLEPWNRPEEMLKTLATLTRQPLPARLRILFAGMGSLTMDLKYRSYDMGLGPQVMFLHQDPEPFLVDMYAACDLTFIPRPLRTDFHEEFPLRLIEGMAVGLAPLVGVGTVAAELAGAAACLYTGDSHGALAATLQKLLTTPGALAAARGAALVQAQSHFSADVAGPRFVQEILDVLAGARRPEATPVTQTLAAISADLQRGAERDALVKAEEALLLDIPSGASRSELQRLKGDAHYALGDVDQAMLSYSEGLRFDERNHNCLRGLGFVAWQGHSNEDAMVFFKKAIALKDDDGETMLGIGLVYRRLGLNEEALFWLEKCAVTHGLTPAIVALAQACAQLPRPRVGIEVLRRTIDAIGENHTLMMTLGQLCLNEGLVDEGSEIIRKALGQGAAA